MIRFSCPGCGATYTVGDQKGGKTGRCPKCQAQFVIPQPDAAAAAPAPTASAPQLPLPSTADPTAAVEIAPCPGCQARLSVTNADLGADVECPYCKTVYRATAATTTASSVGGSRKSRALADDDRPSRRRDEDDDEDDRPSRRRSRRDEYDEDADEGDRPSRRRRDEDDEDRPRKKRKKRRGSDVESKRMVAGLLAILVGAYGVHKFYLGYTSAGIIQLLLTLFTCVGGIIALVEGIIYLTKSDEEFIEIYQIGEKQWF
jgi:TM2 domain-containing membrane protein YozV